MTETHSNIDPGDDNKQLNGLFQDAGSESEFIPVILFELAWTFDSGTVLYGGIPIVDEPRPTLGIKYDTGRFGEFDFNLFYNIGNEVWKDPYLTGVNRVERMGVHLAWKLAALSLSYEWETVDVDRDDVGVCLPDLIRDGTIHKIDAGWEIAFDYGFALTPAIGLEKGCLDGRSQGYTGYSAGFDLIKTLDNFMVLAMVQMAIRDYDAKHPIFGKTRDDAVFEAMAIVT